MNRSPEDARLLQDYMNSLRDERKISKDRLSKLQNANYRISQLEESIAIFQRESSSDEFGNDSEAIDDFVARSETWDS